MTALEATATVEQLEAQTQMLDAQLQRLREDLAGVKRQLVVGASAGNEPVRVAGRPEFRVALEKVVSENRELLSRLAK